MVARDKEKEIVMIDSIQLIIIAVVILLVLVTIFYYLYQEAKFKKLVESNFNHATDDVIAETNNHVILDGIDSHNQSQAPADILAKDIESDSNITQADPLLGTRYSTSDNIDRHDGANFVEGKPDKLQTEVAPHPEDSVEAFFAKIYQIPFGFASLANVDLDFIVDIGFESVKKIRALPELTQFTDKPFSIYVLSKNDEWIVFHKGSTYVARAIKLVLQLVDAKGIISQAQLSNIFNELHKFAMQNDAHICKSDYESSIHNLQGHIRYLNEVKLEITLYLATRQSYGYNNLVKIFSKFGLASVDGVIQLQDANGAVFTITDDSGKIFDHSKQYNLLQLTAKLHKQRDPSHTVQVIFDVTEKFMQQCESRLLTTNKRALTQKDYDSIVRYVAAYVDKSKTNGIELGGQLINRIFK